MTAPALQWSVPDHYIEKRQLFLRSYQFSRKRGAAARLRSSAVRVRRLISVRLRAARRLPQLVWARLMRAVLNGRRRGYLHHRLAAQPPRSCAAGFCRAS
ncbi:hypothetical protein KSP39_PZI003760 [Platanthera zijinensis]|uniref:Uncharacterized protein n=1 Tax=Platanthera zijinensis TaxID=2320716 RepID=A0AAP0GDE5_9ASPA